MSAVAEDIWRLYPMHPSHLPQIMPIEKLAYTHPWSEGIFNDCLKVGYSAWVVTNTLGEVAAYALMSMAVGEAHILNICVAPEQQRKGLASFLLKHLQMVARAAGVTLMLLEVRRSNTAAQQLYENFGFRRIGERRGYYPTHGGREDAFVLALDLQ